MGAAVQAPLALTGPYALPTLVNGLIAILGAKSLAAAAFSTRLYSVLGPW